MKPLVLLFALLAMESSAAMAAEVGEGCGLRAGMMGPIADGLGSQSMLLLKQ